MKVVTFSFTANWTTSEVKGEVESGSIFALRHVFTVQCIVHNLMRCSHSGKSATIRESNHGSGVCKEH